MTERPRLMLCRKILLEVSSSKTPEPGWSLPDVFELYYLFSQFTFHWLQFVFLIVLFRKCFMKYLGYLILYMDLPCVIYSHPSAFEGDWFQHPLVPSLSDPLPLIPASSDTQVPYVLAYNLCTSSCKLSFFFFFFYL